MATKKNPNLDKFANYVYDVGETVSAPAKPAATTPTNPAVTTPAVTPQVTNPTTPGVTNTYTAPVYNPVTYDAAKYLAQNGSAYTPQTYNAANYVPTSNGAYTPQTYTPQVNNSQMAALLQELNQNRPEVQQYEFTPFTYDKYQGKEFNYDYKTDPSWLAYQSQYTNLGNQAMEDTLARIAARTGGVASTYAGAAAQGQYNNYMQQLAAKIPELQRLAYDMYNTEEQRNYNRYMDQVNLDYKNYAANESAKQDAANQSINAYNNWMNAMYNATSEVDRQNIEAQQYADKMNMAERQYADSRADRDQDLWIAAQQYADKMNMQERQYADSRADREEDLRIAAQQYADKMNMQERQYADEVSRQNQLYADQKATAAASSKATAEADAAKTQQARYDANYKEIAPAVENYIANGRYSTAKDQVASWYDSGLIGEEEAKKLLSRIAVAASSVTYGGVFDVGR